MRGAERADEEKNETKNQDLDLSLGHTRVSMNPRVESERERESEFVPWSSRISTTRPLSLVEIYVGVGRGFYQRPAFLWVQAGALASPKIRF